MTQAIELKHPQGVVTITVDGPPDLVRHVAESIRAQFQIQRAKDRHGNENIERIMRMAGMRP